MNTETVNLNIPNITVGKAIDTLAKMYVSFIKKGISLKKSPTPFLWGPAGIGKSNGIFQLAERIESETGKRVSVVDIRLLLFSPTDLRGLPTFNAERTKAVWLKPEIFDMDKSDDVVNILFLDELSAVHPSVQAAAYQICLDRKIGEHTLPDNCIVIAAGNRMTDQSVSYKMPKALCNRLLHFNIKSDYLAWKEWAIENGISHKVIAFLGFDDSRLCVDPEASDLAFCTPRSWEGVSNMLNTVSDDPEEIHDLIAALVGSDTAVEFEAFCRGVIKMPNVNEILEGRCKTKPSSHDVIFALSAALVSKIRNLGDDLTDLQLTNVLNYVKCFPRDFEKVFYDDIGLLKCIQKRYSNTLLNKHYSRLKD